MRLSTRRRRRAMGMYLLPSRLNSSNRPSPPLAYRQNIPLLAERHYRPMSSLRGLKKEKGSHLLRIMVDVSSFVNTWDGADEIAVIHRHTDPLGPIQMPLSSLASATPTQAGPSVRPPPSLCLGLADKEGRDDRTTCRDIRQANAKRYLAQMCSLVPRESSSG